MSVNVEQGASSAMDTSLELSPTAMNSMLSAITPLYPDPSVLPTPSSHIIPPSFPNGVDHPTGIIMPLHVPTPGLSPPVYLPAPMEALEPPPVMRAPAPGLIPDFPPQGNPFALLAPRDDETAVVSAPSSLGSVSSQVPSPSQIPSPPQLPSIAQLPPSTQVTLSQVPSPSIHGLASSYAVGGTSSLASALDTTAVTMGRSRAGSTAVPPAATPFPPMTSSSHSSATTGFPLPTNIGNIVRKQEDSSEDVSYSQLEHMFKSIADQANQAMDACRLHHGAEATTKAMELQSAITVISRIMAMSLSEASISPHETDSLTSFSPPSDSDPPSLFPGSTDPAAMDVSDANNMLGSLHALDSSRKRCASAMDSDRLKFLKREPQDDILPLEPSVEHVPLDVPPLYKSPDAPLHVTMSLNAATTAVPSAPTTRPPSPSFSQTSPSFSSIPHQQPVPAPAPPYDPFAPSMTQPSIDFSVPPTSIPPFPVITSSWSETTAPTTRHTHALSSGLRSNSLVDLQSLVPGPGTLAYPPSAFPSPPVTVLSQSRPAANGPPGISPPLGRISRSGSFTGTYANSYAYSPALYPDPNVQNWPESSRKLSWHGDSPPMSMPTSVPSSSSRSDRDLGQSDAEGDDDDDDHDDDSDGSPPGGSRQLPSGDHLGPSNGHADVPQEYRAEVDRIFFEYLNRICSNLEATDSKGEPIHQTLMAKKMQRLDESPDFRPFKFRIQAFTHAFLEELAKQGYPEEKIPMKKIRQYLWHQQYILRFNEDGKKAKSKGNHIWNVEAKKAGDGKWEFRPFHRKLAGNPPGVAYSGLRWSWTPRIWDPQASWKDIPVQYSSPSLPSWLSWQDDTLSGVPPSDAEACDIVVEAKFMLEGQEGQLTMKFHLNIAPVSALDPSFSSHSRRPSLIGDVSRRTASDSVVTQTPQRSMLRAQPAIVPPSPPTPSHSAQVMQVLTSAAQRVAHERQSQVISAHPQQPGELEDLCKQQHVLTRTANAFSQDPSSVGNDGRILAAAAQQVVMQAAVTVRADRTASVAGIPISPAQSTAMQLVTVNEVSVATQDAVAKAVKINGTASTEVDIIMTAASILKEQARTVPVVSGELLPSGEPKRSHSTGMPVYPPHNVVPLLSPSEYGQLS